ncbi:MAG: TolC family protein [Planctomycetia bacterium]|nr:TolC family protein [Planctomycetia bacterium]
MIARFHRVPMLGGLLLAMAGCHAAPVCRDAGACGGCLDFPCHLDVDLAEGELLAEDSDLAGPHSVDDYVTAALERNPKIQAKRMAFEAARQRVPQAGSLEDPMIDVMGFPFFPRVPQTASGRKTADVALTQTFPLGGKRCFKARQALAEAEAAEAEIAAAELEIVEQVQRAYYDLYYVEKAVEITGESRKLATQITELVLNRLKLPGGSQQDLLRVELEVYDLDGELLRLKKEEQAAQARLARLLHVSPDTPVRALGELPAEPLPDDLTVLYEQGVASRPELHAQLAAISRERFGLELACAQYVPDVTLGAAWGGMTTHKAMAPTADGIDDVALLFQANLPVYTCRLDAGVREAEARIAAAARQYDELRDTTQEEIKALFEQAASQYDLLRLFREQIIPKAEQTLEVSIADFPSGKVDFLQLLDNWRQLLRYRLAEHKLHAELRQTVAALERLVGGPLPIGAKPPVP